MITTHIHILIINCNDNNTSKQYYEAIMARVAGGKPMNPPKERPVKAPAYIYIYIYV